GSKNPPPPAGFRIESAQGRERHSTHINYYTANGKKDYIKVYKLILSKKCGCSQAMGKMDQMKSFNKVMRVLSK
ncbi:MAG: hypothetical protein ACKVH8_24215, partial [Pirellulales bacterium]